MVKQRYLKYARLILSIVFVHIFYLSQLQAGDKILSPGNSSNALPGFGFVGVPVAKPSVVSISGASGYGYLDSTGTIKGGHHSLHGNFGVAVVPVSWLSLGIHLEGAYQKHPDDDEGEDSSLYGDPYLTIRSGFSIPIGYFGGEINVWIPGNQAPSFKMDATSVDLSILYTLVKTVPFMAGLKLGFSFDNSAKATPPLLNMREGDRISLQRSAYNAIPFGLAFSYSYLNLTALFEFSADFLVASKVSINNSPMRISGGFRYFLPYNFQLELLVTGSLSKHPDVSPQAPLIPVEPRIITMLGLNWHWSWKKEKVHNEEKSSNLNTDKTETNEVLVAPKVEEVKIIPQNTADNQPEYTRYAVKIVDGDNLPVAGAKGTICIDEVCTKSDSDKSGFLQFNKIEKGVATITVESEYFETMTWTVTLDGSESQLVETKTLTEVSAGSQIRGLVLGNSGNPVKASIIILPENINMDVDKEGYFESDVLTGEHKVTISAKGYRSQKHTINVDENSVQILNIQLSKNK